MQKLFFIILIFLISKFIFNKLLDQLKNSSHNRKIVKNFDYLFLFRPTLFFVVWLMICIGFYLFYLHSGKNQSLQWITNFNIYSFEFYQSIFLFIGITLISGSTFITNQISDKNSDKVNNKLFLVNKYIKEVEAIKIRNLGYYIGFSCLILTLNIYNIILGYLIYLFWDKIYNVEPYGWKNHPLLGPICNFVVSLFLILSGYIFCITQNIVFVNLNFFNISLLINLLGYLMCYLSVTLLTDIPDIQGDKKNKKNTFTIVFGYNLTLIISTICVVIAFCIGVYLSDPLLSISSIVSLPFFLFAMLRKLDKDILRAIRYPVFILNFFTMLIFPLLIIGLIVIYYFSKYYYWHRFDIHYPTFIVDSSKK